MFHWSNLIKFISTINDIKGQRERDHPVVQEDAGRESGQGGGNPRNTRPTEQVDRLRNLIIRPPRHPADICFFADFSNFGSNSGSRILALENSKKSTVLGSGNEKRIRLSCLDVQMRGGACDLTKKAIFYIYSPSLEAHPHTTFA